MIRPKQPTIPVIYSPRLSPFDREYAIWTFGDYPQVSHEVAEANLMRACVRLGFEWISHAAIWMLELELYESLQHETNTTAA